ncbi:hypothetical protein ABZT07_20695 [Streptomyces sp. NPDC005317]|uniref:hypothetical protein n=1 Tax=Streptomyces sp. NPDC005317 TaxID=3156876 RepID=UPI0033B82E0C
MSLILSRLRGPGLHRAVDEVERLREANERLLAELDEQGRQLADTRTKRAEAEQVAVCLDADLVERNEERDQLLAELSNVRQVLAPFLAAEAAAGAVTVPEMVRDTSALEDQATAPIAVTTLREQFGGSAA